MNIGIYELDSYKKDKYYFLNGNVVKLSNNSPVYTSHDKKRGTCVTKRLFLHNSSLYSYYTNVIISIDADPIVSAGEPYYDISSVLFEVKLIKGWHQPSTAAWLETASYNSLIYPNIGRSLSPDNSYYPFWLAVEAFADSELITDILLDTSISLSLSAREFNFGFN